MIHYDLVYCPCLYCHSLSNIFIQEINKTQLGSYIVIATNNIGRFSWKCSVNQKGKYICISIYFIESFFLNTHCIVGAGLAKRLTVMFKEVPFCKPIISWELGMSTFK
jgi:hypothetical protein